LFYRHNDLPWNIRKFVHNQLMYFNFSADLTTVEPWSKSNWSQTDLPRLRKGMVGAQVSLNTYYIRKIIVANKGFTLIFSVKLKLNIKITRVLHPKKINSLNVSPITSHPLSSSLIVLNVKTIYYYYYFLPVNDGF